MKKTLAILLLLLVAGCGKNDQTSESSPPKLPPPTLADTFKGKRIHFQIPDQKDAWLQLGDNNQVTVNDGGRNMSMSYAINETRLIVDSGGKLIEMRFSKPDLAVGDQVIFLEHTDGTLQTLLDSTDDSGDKTTGSITKIEAAQELDSNESVQSAGQPSSDPAQDALETLDGKIKKNEDAAVSTNKTQEPDSLMDSLRGKRVHLQVGVKNKKEEFWIQVGEADQLTGGSADDSRTITFTRKDNSIFFVTPPEVLQIRFAKTELSAGDQVTFIEHAMKRTDDLQTIVDSAADSTADRSIQGSILKIEAAQPVDPTPPEDE